MSQIGFSSVRSSTLQASDGLLGDLRRAQSQLQLYQAQISSGLRAARPSDEPQLAASILNIQSKLEERDQLIQNQQRALTLLDHTDQALNDATDIGIDVKALAGSQISIDSTAESRAEQLIILDSQIQALIDIANRKFQDTALFAGKSGAVAATDPDALIFTNFLGGIRYNGAQDNLTGNIGLDQPLGINSNGAESFGAVSSRVKGVVDFDPAATAQTRLDDLIGAQGNGIKRGSVVLVVNGASTAIDLATAHTLGDITTRINDAITTLDPAAGAVNVAGPGLAVTANAGHTITISELGAGRTAADLGIAVSVTGAASTPADLNPKLTELTNLATLGVPFDLTSGLKITHGTETRVADFSAAQTVQDLINTVEQLDLGIRLQINKAGTGLDLVSEVSGIELSIGENAGGTTATDMGLRTLGTFTNLSDFNHGRGVKSIVGEDDFNFELHDGTTFGVNLDGVADVADLLATIQSAATAAGLTVGAPGDAAAQFTIGLVSDGNGFSFEDNTAGGGDFRVTPLGQSVAAYDLGLSQNAGTGTAITTGDQAAVRTDGLFTHLLDLREALANNDTNGITLATEGVDKGIDNLIRAHADVGVRGRQVERLQERSSELRNAEQVLLSDLRDADLTEAITRFSQAQQQLEATLRVGVQSLQLSLLDFLR